VIRLRLHIRAALVRLLNLDHDKHHPLDTITYDDNAAAALQVCRCGKTRICYAMYSSPWK
jgi:hypothetical protein